MKIDERMGVPPPATWRQKVPPGFTGDPTLVAIPDNPLDVPDPVGLWRAGYWAQSLVQWVTDTGVSVRARLPFIRSTPVVKPPEPSGMSGTTQLAVAGFLSIELVLLWSIQMGFS